LIFFASFAFVIFFLFSFSSKSDFFFFSDVTTATVALAYLFALYLLFRVNIKARKTKYAFWFWRSFMIWFFIGTAFMIIAPCFIAFTCSCDGIVCNSYQGKKNAAVLFAFF
jgi:amino acid transporter